MLLDYEYELVKSPAGALAMATHGRRRAGPGAGRAQPDRRLPTMMTTADMAFKMDPIYAPISRRFRDDPDRVRRRLRPRLVR